MRVYLASYLSVYLTSYLACYLDFYLESHIPPWGLSHLGTTKNMNGLFRAGTELDLGIYQLNTSVTMFRDDFIMGKSVLFIVVILRTF